MKKFITVFQFELMSYIKNKSYMVTTILMAVLLAAVMFVPRVVDISDMLGIEQSTEEETEEETEEQRMKAKPLGSIR